MNYEALPVEPEGTIFIQHCCSLMHPKLSMAFPETHWHGRVQRRLWISRILSILTGLGGCQTSAVDLVVRPGAHQQARSGGDGASAIVQTCVRQPRVHELLPALGQNHSPAFQGVLPLLCDRGRTRTSRFFRAE